MEQPKARLTLQQHQQAINEAIWIDASPHEWPTVDKMWLLCSALIDSVQLVDYLRIRLAAVEAERDAARAEAEKEEKDCLQVIAERDEHEERLNRIFSALGMDEAESEWSSANDPAALAIEKAEELRAALLTARAGQARAVEALNSLVNDCTTAHPDWGIDITKPSGSTMSKAVSVLAGCSALAWLADREQAAAEEARIGKARVVEALKALTRAALARNYWLDTCSRTLAPDWEEKSNSAIDGMNDAMTQASEIADSSDVPWLAQQRREAAVEALEKLATDLRKDPWGSTLHDVDSLRGILRARAAALWAGEAGND